MNVVVIGAGVMGLAAGYHAARAGHNVTIIEVGPEPGGMAAHFDFGGVSLERYYHFICTSDHATFDLLQELGISDKLRWRRTTMGQFANGKLHRWGDPIGLLVYPGLSLIAKLRYGAFAYIAATRKRWDVLEYQSASYWLEKWAGSEAYRKLWEPLLRLKFHEYANDISAAWMWTRIRRLARSRSSIFAEKLGYLEGGSETLVEALTNGIEAAGGKLLCRTPAQKIVITDGRVAGVESEAGFLAADHVISTVPAQLVSRLAPDLPASWRAGYDAIRNIAVCCVVFKLSRSVSPHFWVNVADPSIPVPGIIEFSNLRPFDDTIVFVPYYMPVTNERWSWSDDQLVEEAYAALQKISPSLTLADRIDARVGRLRHAQPVCEPGFAKKLPPVQTPIGGLQIADTCFYYPEDRGVSESVHLGRQMAARLARA